MKNGAVISFHNGLSIIVDAEDVGEVLKYHWCKSNGYAIRSVKHPTRPRWRKHIPLHRHLTNATKGDCVDHKNCNRLDNRRSNLRVCSVSENGWNRGKPKNNRSGYKGVSFHRQAKKYSSEISIKGKRHYLGLFVTAEEAHAAYCQKAKELHGEFFNPG